MRLSQWDYLGKFIDDYDKKKIFSVIISNITKLEDISNNTIFHYVRQCELLIEIVDKYVCTNLCGLISIDLMKKVDCVEVSLGADISAA